MAAINNLPHLRDKKVDVAEALKYAERFPDMFTTPIWLAFKTLKGKSVFKSRKPDIDPYYSDPVATFGKLGARAWRILGSKASITISVSSSGDKEKPHQIHRTLRYGGEQFEFTSRDILEDRVISEAKVTELLITRLKPVAQIFMLQTDPEFKSCDLAEFAHAQNSFPARCPIAACNDKELADATQLLTRRSRRWSQNNETLDAYVFVPDLFDDRLNSRERRARMMYNEIVEIEKESSGTTDDITYVGRDADNKLGKAKLRGALEDNARARAMLNGGRGSRSNPMKEHDDWMGTLSKHAIASNARYRD